MQWIKDGQIFDGRITQNGEASFIAGELPAEQMRSLGYEEYTPPAPPKRYSKLKIIRALGEGWPDKRDELAAAGMLDEFMAAQYLAADDPVFGAVYATLTDEEKTMLEGCQYD